MTGRSAGDGMFYGSKGRGDRSSAEGVIGLVNRAGGSMRRLSGEADALRSARSQSEHKQLGNWWEKGW